MKKYMYPLFVALFATMSVNLTSCGGDDDEPNDGNLWQGELGAPAHEDDAVAYKITGSSDFSSIELTASGNYIVIPARSSYNAPKAEKRSIFRAASKESRAYYGGNVFGTYTKNSDGSYNLKDFGTLGAYNNGTLELTLIDGTEYTLNATKLPNIDNNALNDRFCRTWYIQKAVETVFDMQGNVIDSQTLTGSDLKADYVQYVVVTKAGTFLQVDWGGWFESDGSWNWIDTKNQKFHYVFSDYAEDNGDVQVAFDGDLAIFKETSVEYDEDYGQCKFQSTLTCRAQ